MGALKTAVMMSFKEEAILDLFNEQAFGPAFGRVLLDSIEVLISNGLPPEAALIEMYISEEMAYTYRKMAQIGLVKQTNFHSHTSQYGAMSRGIRYTGLGLKKIMQKTYDEIASGKFAEEWQKPSARVKFKVIKYFAMRQKINRIEEEVRNHLHLKSWDIDSTPDEIETLLASSDNPQDLEKYKDLFEIDDK
jgi:ketol-acid reductoisomerase